MITETLEVSRSNIREQLDNVPKLKIKKNVDDEWLLPLIKEITDSRPTYGYRRVKAILNLKLTAINKEKVNHKRIYRIMKENNLLLTRYGAKRMQAHDGSVVTLKSNTIVFHKMFKGFAHS